MMNSQANDRVKIEVNMHYLHSDNNFEPILKMYPQVKTDFTVSRFLSIRYWGQKSAD